MIRREVKRLREAAASAEMEGRWSDAAVLWALVSRRMARRSMAAAVIAVVLAVVSVVLALVGAV